jgi:hypothetical protein
MATYDAAERYGSDRWLYRGPELYITPCMLLLSTERTRTEKIFSPLVFVVPLTGIEPVRQLPVERF